jgi:ActR/RegA family two-component response regulator
MSLYTVNEDFTESQSDEKRRGFKVTYKIDAITTWRAHGCNLRQTARRLGLYRSTLRRWIQREPALRASDKKRNRQNVQTE